MVYLTEAKQTVNGSEIFEFVRKSDGVKTIKKITKFEPYFYTPTGSHYDESKVADCALSRGRKTFPHIKRYEKGFKDLLGNAVDKVICNRSTDIGILKYGFTRHYEADILFQNRYMIDEYFEKKIEKANLRKNYLDIETRDIPDMEKADMEITLITCYDSYLEKTITWVYTEDPNVSEINIKETYKLFHSEIDMLKNFISFINTTSPDVILGYNVVKFDIFYIIKRCKILGIDCSDLSPIGDVYVDDKWKEPTIKGIVLFDVYRAIKKISSGEFDSYKLNDVSQKVLGKGKRNIEDSFENMWKNNLKRFIEYNIVDVLLVKELDDKLKILDFFDEIRRITKCQIKDVFNNTLIWDAYILSKYHNKYVFPSKVKQEEHKYKGAYVLTPVQGVHSNTIFFDLKSLYPSIMVSCNMCYTTINPKGNINITDDIQFYSVDQKKGLFTEMIEELFILRDVYKEKRDSYNKETQPNEYNSYETLQTAIKVILNSLYGAVGYEKFRLYNRDIARAVTKVGREIIKWTKDTLEKIGYQVVYGDTDSVAVVLQKNTKEEIDMLLKHMNASYNEFVKQYNLKTHKFLIQNDKVCKKILFTDKKKRYAYIDNENKLKIVGFQSRRSDSSQISKIVQKRILSMILGDEDRESVVQYLKDICNKITNRQISDENIGFPQGIQNDLDKYITTNPCVEGCKYSNKYLGTQYKRGNKPKWIYIKKVPLKLPHTASLAYDFAIPEGFEPNWDRVLPRVFDMPLEPLFKSRGWKWEKIYRKNKNLEDWF